MNSRRQFLASLAAAPCLASVAPAFSAERANAGELLLGAYNLRFASDKKPNAWPDRRPVVKALLDQYQPDIWGTQEGRYHQIKDIAADQPGYDWIGTGRDGGSRGEFMAIFYKRERFEPLEFDHFWLSDTPEVIASATWGNSNRRMVTWARFKDRVTEREFYFWNTHFDHQVQEAREKAATLVLERLAQVNSDLPLFLVGDFNAVAGDNKTYDILTRAGGLTDTWHSAKERRNERANTFNGFGELKHEGKRIDWVLARGDLDVRATEIVTFRQGGQWPSDHCPVLIWAELK